MNIYSRTPFVVCSAGGGGRNDLDAAGGAGGAGGAPCRLLSSLELNDTKVHDLEYEPSSEQVTSLTLCVMALERLRALERVSFFFFMTLELSD